MYKKIAFYFFLIISLTLIPQKSIAQEFNFENSNNELFQINQKQPLKVSEAFSITEVVNEEKNQLKIIFDIKPNHYIYEKDLSVFVNGFLYNNYITTSENVKDEFYGNINVIKNSFSINVNNYNEIKNIKINYRGCSPKFGICYPEQVFEKSYQKDTDTNNKLSVENQDVNKNINILGFEVSYNDLFISFFIVFMIGILVSLTPCVLPMIPIVSSLIISQNITRKRVAAYLSSMYVIGTSIAYGLIGFLTTIGGFSIQSYTQTPAFLFIASILLILFSLTLFDVVKMPNFTKVNSKINDKINRIKINGFSVIIIGFLSSLIVSPCVAAPLASILVFTSTIGNPIISFLYLFMFGIGSGLILILIATNLNRFKIKSGSYMNFIKYLMGFLLLLISIYLLDRVVSQKEIIDILYNISFLYFFATVIKNITMRKISFLILILLLSFGRHTISNYVQTEDTINNNDYEIITKETELNDKSKIFIKVSADWCIYCKDLEKNVYGDSYVQNEIQKHFTNYTLDITEISKYEQSIMDRYNIISAPAVIIIDNDNNDVFTYNGSISKEELLKKIKH